MSTQIHNGGESLIQNNDPLNAAVVNITYLLDISGSMIHEPINQLNVAMSEAVQIAEEVGIKLECDVIMRVIRFNSIAEWHIGDAESGQTHIDWKPLEAKGGTDTAGAIKLARSVMTTKNLGISNYQPIVILFTDGKSKEPEETKKEAEKLRNSLRNSKGESRVICIAIGVKDAVQEELEAFASRGTIRHPNGTEEKDAPLVFKVSDINLIKDVLMSVTRGSITSSFMSSRTSSSEGQSALIDMTPDSDPANTTDGSWPTSIIDDVNGSSLVQ